MEITFKVFAILLVANFLLGSWQILFSLEWRGRQRKIIAAGVDKRKKGNDITRASGCLFAAVLSAVFLLSREPFWLGVMIVANFILAFLANIAALLFGFSFWNKPPQYLYIYSILVVSISIVSSIGLVYFYLLP